MAEPGFWDRPEEAQKLVARLKTAKRALDEYGKRDSAQKNLGELLDMAEAESDESLLLEIEKELTALETQVTDLETRSLLSGPHDQLGALVIIHPGAGGTESQDWAEMLMRMYQRWAERRGYKLTVLDYQAGDEAGIKDATLEIDGEFAYGYLKGETGVHRLVRISPYDAAARRHTSFSSISVLPMLDETIKVEIAPGDLRVDTMRAGGAGGQHVNKTESAIRITHIPTGIVVACQAERSQHKNRESAMRTIRSKLYQLELAKREAELAKFYGDRGSISWGNQIRSYVLQPYQMCKDLRTEVETSDVHGVLDGDLNPFIEGYLKQRKDEVKK
jgi:peptide chain release factor 2